MEKANETIESISFDDLSLLGHTIEQVALLHQQGEVIKTFTLNHLSKKYSLKEGDSIDQNNGVITRASVLKEVK